MVVLSPLGKFLIKQGYKKNKGISQGQNVRAPYKGKTITGAERRGEKFTPAIERRMEQLHSIGVTTPTLMARLLGSKLSTSQIMRIMNRKGLRTDKNIEKYIEPSLVSPRKRVKGKAIKDKAGESSYAGPIDVNFPTKEIRKNYVADLRARSKLPQGDPARMTDQQMADKYFYFSKNPLNKMAEINRVLRKQLNIPEKPVKYTGDKAEMAKELRKVRLGRIEETSDPRVEKTLAVTRDPKLGFYSPELSHRAKDSMASFSKTLGYAPGRLNRGAIKKAEEVIDQLSLQQNNLVYTASGKLKSPKQLKAIRPRVEKLNEEKMDIILGKPPFDKVKGQLAVELINISNQGRLTKSMFNPLRQNVVDPLNLTKGANVKGYGKPKDILSSDDYVAFEAARETQIENAKRLNKELIKKYGPKYKDGGRVDMSIGGLTGSKGGLNLDDRVSKVGTLESMLAGVGAGLIDIPKGAFTLGAALLDMGFGTSNAAKVEKYFDDLTTFDEKAEQTFAGDLTRIMVNLGVPGGFAFKKGADLATKAMLHKKNGNYFRLTDPKLQERFKTSLNAKGRLFATLGGAGAAGVSDMIFVGDPEHVGTIGDMFGGPTQLRPNDENSASREVANRMKFGLDSSLLIGAVGGLGSSIKSLIRRRNELESNNDAIDKFFAYLRPRGKKTQEFFDIERENLGLRRSDINRAEEISRQLDKHIDAIFPFVKNPFNKLGNDGRREFMAKLNDTLLSGDYKISAETGKTEFGLMDEKLVKEITDMMYKKGGSRKDVEGVINEFYNIRAGWQLMFDDLGTAMGKDALTEFAPIFGKKLKDYLGSTYEIFRNKSVIPMLNYKPTEQAVEKMIKLFTESAADKGVKLEREQAEYYVDQLIASAKNPATIAVSKERASGVYFNAPDFFVNKTTLSDLEMTPKTFKVNQLTGDAKEVVEELLGKVEDPLQTILTGTNKLSLVTRRNQLFQTLKKSNDEILEKRAKFIEENPGKEIPAALRGMFRETDIEAIDDLGKNIKQIEIDSKKTEEAGITNPLDGLFAERGVAEAIEQTAMVSADKSNLLQLYQNFILYPKATSQLAKTVLSPITHARNFISAGAFAAANGIIPGLTVSPDDMVKAFKEAYGALQIPGARLDNPRYRELLRLGVVNTNVRLGDLQKLLKDVNFGETFDSNVALRNMMRPLSKLKKWTEDMYTAEDDFWKITTFAVERSRLEDTYKKFGMKYTKELLDEEAAKIVKNNVPNYDYVNDFVKDLRQLPFGNFVSFPAEIYRTGYNIMNQAWKEIFTTHTLADGRVVTPFRSIGMKRMFGLASTVVGVPYGTVEAFKAIHDVTEEEMAALRRFVPEWSKNSTLVPIRDEDGTLKYVDFSHANAYDTLIRPITTLMNGVQQGLEEDAVFKNTFLAMIDATKETASPFVSESIWTQALFDVAPIAGRGGRTLEGRRLWTDETPWGDAFYSGLKHLGATIVPGSLPALGRMRNSLTETVDEYGRSYEFLDEALGVAGMRVVDVDPVRSMKFKIADFRTGINNSRREFTGPLLRGGPITPEQVVDQFQKANDSLFRVQKKMFQDYYAARTLGVSDRALENTFQDRVSNKQVRAIQTGRFTPFIPSENIEQAFADNARAIGEPDAYRAARSQIQRLIRRYQRLKMGDVFPLIDNPFRATISERAIGPISQLGGTPLDNTSLAQPLIGGQQVATAQRGQQVFGSTDPIFGTT